MSKLDDLINQLCPDGVEYRKLGEICELVRGNGLQKKDFINDGVGCIHYGQIYTYFSKHGIATNNVISFVPNELAKTLKSVNPGDLVMACTSENIDDVGKNVVWEGYSPIVTGGHSIIIKPKHEHIAARYLSYFTQTSNFYNQKKLIVTGTKVVELSPKKLAKVELPVPPLIIQQTIIEILDKFTSLQAELQAELKLRSMQYEFYRNQLLAFDSDESIIVSKAGGVRRSRWLDDLLAQYCPDGVEYRKLGEVAEIGTGSSDRKDAVEDGMYPFYVRSKDVLRIDRYQFNEEAIVIPGEGGIGDIFHYVNGKYGLHQRAYRVHATDVRLDTKFLYYYLQYGFKDFILKHAVNATVISIRKPMLENFQLPILPLVIQQKIVNILDKFSDYTASLTDGLPAEIKLRQQQYEYYRDKLLTFKRKDS